MGFEHYIEKSGKNLRYGYTTGSCAALAAKGAAEILLGEKEIADTTIMTPKGFEVEVKIHNVEINEDFVSCSVQKDAGDDPDVTHKSFIFAKVMKSKTAGIHIDGGKGVGRVTRPGLDQPIGNAAINSTPRRMIAEEVLAICEKYGYDGGLDVIISVPNGEEIAKKTFNSQIGIVGGISILGTSGIVEPQSAQALLDCIELELKAYNAENKNYVVLTPGNYGETFLGGFEKLKNPPIVKISNFVGDSLKYAMKLNFKYILMVGHIGKFSKLAGGITNTHSDYGDCRVEIMAAHAALCGASQQTVEKIMNSVTTDDCIAHLDEEGLREKVIKSMFVKIEHHLKRKVNEDVKIGALMFSNKYGFLGQTEGAEEVIEYIKSQEKLNGK